MDKINFQYELVKDYRSGKLNEDEVNLILKNSDWPYLKLENILANVEAIEKTEAEIMQDTNEDFEIGG